MERSKKMDDRNRESVYEEIKKEVDRLLKQTLRPEFLNRIDEIVVFHPLGMDEIQKIVDLQFREIQEKLYKLGITLELTNGVRELLARTGYEPAFGARPLKRMMQKLITNPLASRVLSGDFKNGDRLEVVVKENSLDFTLKSQ